MPYDFQSTPNPAMPARTEFERLTAELSFKFINLPSDQIAPAIQEGLRQVGETLDVDRCALFGVHERDLSPVPIGFWWRPSIEPPPAVTSFKERFPWAQETILAGTVLSFSCIDEIPNPVDRASCVSHGIQSGVTVPISVSGRVKGAMGFNMTRGERTWTRDTLQGMRILSNVFAGLLVRSEEDDAERQRIVRAERPRDRRHAENMYLRREAQERLGDGIIIGQSPAIRHVLEQAEQVAVTDSTVLLLGETGTGKELIATHIHEQGARRGRVMVRVNCSAIPSTLMESELFGREKGAFTGALARQIGRFELADHSTIFLDEIGDLPGDVQVKLLRVLEERQIERLGSPKAVHVDVRIIAATHRDLEKRIAEGAFRDDLFYRLDVFPIRVPPLRDRPEDIPLLVWRFVDEFSHTFGKRIDAIPRGDMAALQQYSWPGNIRELRNVVERAMIVAKGTQLNIAVPAPSSHSGTRSLKLTDVEREHIRGVLEMAAWRIRGATGAAQLLGLKPTTLEGRMAKLGLVRPRQA
jgi:transcriptional regulator with GAF, ATPase, and Fis domain